MTTEEKKEETPKEEKEILKEPEEKEKKIEDISPSKGGEYKVPDIKPGMVVRVHQKIKESDTKGKTKERIQVFEGMVIAHHAGLEPGATFIVRKVTKKGGVAVEKIFPLYLPTITKIEIVRKHKVRRSKLYFLRGKYKKKMKETKE